MIQKQVCIFVFSTTAAVYLMSAISENNWCWEFKHFNPNYNYQLDQTLDLTEETVLD